MAPSQVVTAISQHPDAVQAVTDIRQQLGNALSGVICFCSSSYHLDALGTALKRCFSCPIIGCTTAGEIINSHGYVSHSLVAMGFRAGVLNLEPLLIQPLHPSAQMGLGAMVHRQIQAAADPDFAFLMCDGLSGCEEYMVAAAQHSLGSCPLIGGSAGDDTRFAATHVYYNGAFHRHAGLIGLCRSSVLQPEPFQIQHFIPSQRKLVITQADPQQRVIREIDGIPAAQAYAAAIGCAVEDLQTATFAAHPLMLRLGGRWFVRSVQQRHDDGSLTFYCGIEQGLVLSMGKAGDLATDLRNELRTLISKKGSIEAIIVFDCILRRIDAQGNGLLPTLEKILAPYPLIGMSTYGEQCHGIHVNHTMTGMVLRGAHD